MFLENDIMFFESNVMLFLLFRILLPRLEFYSVAVPSCKFMKRRITKMAPQGAIPNYLKPKGCKRFGPYGAVYLYNLFVAITKGLILIKYRTFIVAQKCLANKNHNYFMKLVL